MMSLLQELNANQLRANTTRGFPDTRARQHLEHTCRVTKMIVVPLQARNEVMFKFQIETTEASVYQGALVFGNLTFMDPKTLDDPSNIPDDWIELKISSDSSVYVDQPLKLNLNNLRAKCGCLDFYWRFARFNKRDKSLYGRVPPKYYPTTNRPSVNPMRVSGLCKHLLACARHLTQENFLS